ACALRSNSDTGRDAGRTEANDFAVAGSNPGASPNDSPVRHDGDTMPLGVRRDPGPEPRTTLDEQRLRLFIRMPPPLIETFERQIRKVAGEIGTDGAGVAREADALPNERLDPDGQSRNLRDDRCRLDSPPVRTGEDLGHVLRQQRLSRRTRLF